MQKKLMGALAMAAVATLAVSGAATAAQPATKAKARTTTVVYQGVQVAIDPATGRLRAPTAAQRRALSAAMLENQARTSARPVDEAQARATFKRNRRTGAMSMQVPESQVSYLAAHRTADGAVEVGHEAVDTNAAAPAEVTP